MHCTATDYFRPWRNRPVNLSPISHAADLDNTPFQENPSQPGEPTMPLRCIRTRSTDEFRCEGIWACACGRSKDRLGMPKIECDHIIPASGRYSPWKIASDSIGNSHLQRTLNAARQMLAMPVAGREDALFAGSGPTPTFENRRFEQKPDFSGFSSAGFAAVIHRPRRHRPA
jgi:hypothetical protein